MSLQTQQQNETSEVFEERRKRVHDSFVTSMTIQSEDGAMSHGNDERFLEEDNLPDRIRSVFFTTISVPKAVLNFDPLCRIVVFLDFSVPSLFDFNRLPTLPTPNESNFETGADNHSWFTSTNALLGEYFNGRKTNNNWLHRGAMYDVLLFLIGLPISIWVTYRLSHVLSNSIPTIVSSAIYIYSFLLSLIFFRVLFSYTRWVFPKVELESQQSSHAKHRKAWFAIVLPLALAIIYDVGKTLFIN